MRVKIRTKSLSKKKYFKKPSLYFMFGAHFLSWRMSSWNKRKMWTYTHTHLVSLLKATKPQHFFSSAAQKLFSFQFEVKKVWHRSHDGFMRTKKTFHVLKLKGLSIFSLWSFPEQKICFISFRFEPPKILFLLLLSCPKKVEKTFSADRVLMLSSILFLEAFSWGNQFWFFIYFTFKRITKIIIFFLIRRNPALFLIH